ncbi:glycine zipper 2TM domain-containing protein [Tahibacter amnicola]|uniref:Glycine zipper 2TM domain-containing protein n=1 Tax=Tahibacter amnicola TaxID=2976241 RepID=A0ABY6BH30_9GAMM|nr:glycine zipper 2TM domain-containing protein [Tahibacter amnicola]UXI69069.1 glycine zipper 2TM domain-containing protein [Tahibacter amnicola]
METKLILGIATGVVIAVGGMAAAQRYSGQSQAAAEAAREAALWADVRSVHPVIEKITTPRRDCEQATVTKRLPERDGNVGGTVIGALVGGAIGNQVGGGKGRQAATVGGAVAGGFIGHEMDKRHVGGRVVTSTETRCRTVEDVSEKVVGYDVTYLHNGREYTTRMDHDPGTRLRVEPTVQPVQSRP